MGCTFSKGTKSSMIKSKTLTNSLLSLNLKSSVDLKRVTSNKEIELKSFSETFSQKRKKAKLELSDAELQSSNLMISEKSEIRRVLIDHFLFKSLPLKTINTILNEFLLYKIDAGGYVFHQGSPGSNFYIVSSGAVDVIVNGIVKSKLKEKSCFGDIELLHNTLRTASIRALENSCLWVLSKDAFNRVIEEVANLKSSNTKKFIENSAILNYLSSSRKALLLELLVCQEFKSGDRILSEGDPGEIFYLIRKGSVTCSMKGIEVRRMGVGEFFGEQAFIHGTYRSATVEALTKVSVLSLSFKDLIEVFGSSLPKMIYKNSLRIAFEKSIIFKNLSEAQTNDCISAVKIKSLVKGDLAFRMGEIITNQLIFILKGRLHGEEAKYECFECISDGFLNSSENHFAENIYASQEADLGIISKLEFESCIGESLDSWLTRNSLIGILQEVDILRAFPIDKLKILTNRLKLQSFDKGHTLFTQGDHADFLYIIKKGEIEVFKDGHLLRSFFDNESFGEKPVLFNESHSTTAYCKIHSQVWCLHRSDVSLIFDDPLELQQLSKNALQIDVISLSDLKHIRPIGEGMSGKVHLVEYSNNYYALKSIEREMIQKYQVYKNLQSEQQFLLELDHPMIMKFFKTFQDNSKIYFLCEYVKGTDMFDMLREVESLNENIAFFYISSLFLAVKYLHDMSIIHRDLKPDNIMIDEDGYIKLIDFRSAKVLKFRTFSVLGTPHYIAPEVLKGAGYGFEVDCWSLGVILYEILFSSLPFADEEKDTYRIYKCVLDEEPEFPACEKKFGCVGLIKKLLCKDPKLRGDCKCNMKDQWFNGMNWEKLFGKKFKPPFLPKTEKMCRLKGVDDRIQGSQAGAKDCKENCTKFWDALF